MIVATWNVGDGPDSAKAGGLTRLFNLGCDVIALQEAGDRKHMIDAWCERQGWQAWLGEGPGAASVPILWNPRTARAMVTGTTPATSPTRVGRRGAGPSTMKAKVWNRVRFATDDGPLVVINGHIVPSVYLPARRALARRQIAVLAAMVRRRKGRVPVVAVGDFNMRASDHLTLPLRDLGMTQHTHAPTHGRRTIDLVWTLGVDGRAEVVDTKASDHKAVVFSTKEKS